MEIYFNYDLINQSFDPPIASPTKLDVQSFIPYSQKYNLGWCSYHNQWEKIIVNPYQNRMYFSCGTPALLKLGLNQKWNLNQFVIEYDFQNMFLIVKQKFTFDEIRDKTYYNPKIVYAKYFDFNRGKVYYPKNYNLKEIPEFLNTYLTSFFDSCSKQKFGIEIKRNNYPLVDFVKFPTCPNFAKLIPVIDDGSKYNFRDKINLFKDFCTWMKIKESKKVRKAFMKEPRTLLVYAMCQQIGFTDSNAIQLIAENEYFIDTYALPNDRLRFSMARREVYMCSTFFNYENNYHCNFINALRLWVQNALTDKTQIVVAKRMLKFMLEENHTTIFDTGQAYFLNARNLPIPFHERILQEGFTTQIHNQLYVLNGGVKTNSTQIVAIPYSEDELSFEMVIYKSEVDTNKVDPGLSGKIFKLKQVNSSFDRESINSDEFKNAVDEDANETDVNDFNQELNLPEWKFTFNIARRFKEKDTSKNNFYFLLPKDTNELYEISENMHNCVGYLYRDKAINKKCTIVVMMHQNKFMACIELKKLENSHYKIVQLKGPMNNIVEGENLTAVKLWSKKNPMLQRY